MNGQKKASNESYAVSSLRFQQLVSQHRSSRPGRKVVLYEQHGVREYRIVDPEAEFVEEHERQTGKVVHMGHFAAGDMFESPVLADSEIGVTSIFSR